MRDPRPSCPHCCPHDRSGLEGALRPGECIQEEFEGSCRLRRGHWGVEHVSEWVDRARSAESTSGGPPWAAASEGACAAVPSRRRPASGGRQARPRSAISRARGHTEARFLKREASLLAVLRNVRRRKGRIPQAGALEPQETVLSSVQGRFQVRARARDRGAMAQGGPSADRTPPPRARGDPWVLSSTLCACSLGTCAVSGHGASAVASAGALRRSPGSGRAPMGQVPAAGPGAAWFHVQSVCVVLVLLSCILRSSSTFSRGRLRVPKQQSSPSPHAAAWEATGQRTPDTLSFCGEGRESPSRLLVERVPAVFSGSGPP